MDILDEVRQIIAKTLKIPLDQLIGGYQAR